MILAMRGKKVFHGILGVMLAVAMVMAEGCKKKKDSNSSSSTPDEESTENVSQAFPGGLTLSVIEGGSSAALRLADDEEPANMAEAVEEQQKRLKGEGECLPSRFKSQEAVEAKTNMSYEFDQDMLWGGSKQGSAPATTDYYGTQNGLDANDEAAMPSFARDQINDIKEMVEDALGMNEAIICQFKKDNPEGILPEKEGDELDLKDAADEVFGGKMDEVTVATMKRLANAKGRPVYLTVLRITDGLGRPRSVDLVHSPHEDGNQKGNSGVLSMRMEGDVLSKDKATGAAAMYRFLSIAYEKSLDKKDNPVYKAELRTATVHSDIADTALNEDNTVNFNITRNFDVATSDSNYGKPKKADGSTYYSQANEAIDKIKYVSFLITQDKVTFKLLEGNLSYWMNPGGTYTENARGFNIKLTRDDKDNVLGEAVSGSANTDMSNGTSITKFLKEGAEDETITLAAKGFWHPFMRNPSTTTSDSFGTKYTATQGSSQIVWYKTKTGDATKDSNFSTQQNGTLVTRQCFIMEDGKETFAIDADTCGDNDAGFDLVDSGVASDADNIIEVAVAPGEITPPSEDVKEEAEKIAE